MGGSTLPVLHIKQFEDSSWQVKHDNEQVIGMQFVEVERLKSK